MGHLSDAAMQMHNANSNAREGPRLETAHLSDAVMQMHNAHVSARDAQVSTRDSMAMTRDSQVGQISQHLPPGFGQGLPADASQLLGMSRSSSRQGLVQEAPQRAMSRHSSRGSLRNQGGSGVTPCDVLRAMVQESAHRSLSRASSRGQLNGQPPCDAAPLGAGILTRSGMCQSSPGDSARLHEAVQIHGSVSQHRPQGDATLCDVVMQMNNSNASNASQNWPASEAPRLTELPGMQMQNLNVSNTFQGWPTSVAAHFADATAENRSIAVGRQQIERLELALQKSQQEVATLREEKKTGETSHARDIHSLELMLETLQAENAKLKKLVGVRMPA